MNCHSQVYLLTHFFSRANIWKMIYQCPDLAISPELKRKRQRIVCAREKRKKFLQLFPSSSNHCISYNLLFKTPIGFEATWWFKKGSLFAVAEWLKLPILFKLTIKRISATHILIGSAKKHLCILHLWNKMFLWHLKRVRSVCHMGYGYCLQASQHLCDMSSDIFLRWKNQCVFV